MNERSGSPYVYLNSEPGVWTVGFYDPKGTWMPESDYDARENAAQRVALLNGRTYADRIESLLRECLGDYGSPNFTDRYGMADRIRAALSDSTGEKR